jgi:hypothetical protein
MYLQPSETTRGSESMNIVDFDREKLLWLNIPNRDGQQIRYVKEGAVTTAETVHVDVEPRDDKPYPLLRKDEQGKYLIENENYPERIIVEVPEGVIGGYIKAYTTGLVAYRKENA